MNGFLTVCRPKLVERRTETRRHAAKQDAVGELHPAEEKSSPRFQRV